MDNMKKHSCDDDPPDCISSGYYFLFRDALCVWQPQTRGFLMVLEDDVTTFRRCQDYLRAHGLSFQTLDDLISHASAARWPQWDQIAASYGNSSAPDDESGSAVP
jgi:hypothetical protein